MARAKKTGTYEQQKNYEKALDKQADIWLAHAEIGQRQKKAKRKKRRR